MSVSGSRDSDGDVGLAGSLRAREERGADGVNASAGSDPAGFQAEQRGPAAGRAGAGLAAAARGPPRGICEAVAGTGLTSFSGPSSTPPPATTLPTHTALPCAASQPRRPDTRRSAGLVRK